jgi:hypothetical protein
LRHRDCACESERCCQRNFCNCHGFSPFYLDKETTRDVLSLPVHFFFSAMKSPQADHISQNNARGVEVGQRLTKKADL